MEIIVLFLVLSVLPIIIALSRQHHNALAIIALTIVAGWTIIGWIVALVWSLTEVKHKPAAQQFTDNAPFSVWHMTIDGERRGMCRARSEVEAMAVARSYFPEGAIEVAKSATNSWPGPKGESVYIR